MKKVVIYSSSSMAGHVLNEYFSLKDNYIVDCIEENEIFDKNFILRKDMAFSDSDYIINCVRCLVEESESNPTKAIVYNSYLPNLLYSHYNNSQTKIIQLSTDCVFSGKKGNYDEDSIQDGISKYAKTKSLGEINSEKDILIRTSYIGPTLKGKNEELFDWFLLQNGEIDGYCNAFWNGITTLELAKQIDIVIKNNICGVYHLCSNDIISKYDLLVILKKQWKKNNVKIKESLKHKIDRSLIDNRKELKVSSYDKMFKELYGFMKKNKKLYSHYNYT